MHQNSIPFFPAVCVVPVTVAAEGKVSLGASRWQATGFRMIDSSQLAHLATPDLKYELAGMKIRGC